MEVPQNQIRVLLPEEGGMGGGPAKRQTDSVEKKGKRPAKWESRELGTPCPAWQVAVALIKSVT